MKGFRALEFALSLLVQNHISYNIETTMGQVAVLRWADIILFRLI